MSIMNFWFLICIPLTAYTLSFFPSFLCQRQLDEYLLVTPFLKIDRSCNSVRIQTSIYLLCPLWKALKLYWHSSKFIFLRYSIYVLPLNILLWWHLKCRCTYVLPYFIPASTSILFSFTTVMVLGIDLLRAKNNVFLCLVFFFSTSLIVDAVSLLIIYYYMRFFLIWI